MKRTDFKKLFVPPERLEIKQDGLKTSCFTSVSLKKCQLLKVGSGSRDISVGIATGYGLDDQGEREFESR
jgi:hypothetical protein